MVFNRMTACIFVYLLSANWGPSQFYLLIFLVVALLNMGQNICRPYKGHL